MSVAISEPTIAGMGTIPVVVHMLPVVEMSDEQFFEFCQLNRDLNVERNAQGDLIIMSPVGYESGDRESEINMQVRNWSKRDGTGKTFSSSTGFRLPNGACRSPDTAWVRLARCNALSAEERKRFAPICPDFIVELRSESDLLVTLQDKMEEYIENGAELGLLVDPLERKVHIYGRGRQPETLDNPPAVSCEPELPGFSLDLREIW